jgi:hypothetical protein
MALATLSIDLEARLARFEQGMARATGLLDKLDRAATSSGQRIAEIFTGFFSAEVALQAVQSLAAAFPAIVNGLDDLNDAADATGSTVELLSALEDIARRNGATLDVVSAAVGKLNQALKDADPDSPTSRAIKAIGLDANELRRLDPSEALQKVAQALAGYADDGNKARLMQVLLSRSAQELAPFLKDLADAGKLNATVTTQQAAEAEKFNKELAALSTNTSNAARSLVSEMLPAINQTIDLFRQGAKEGKGFFQTLREEQLRALGIAPKTDIERLKELNNLLERGRLTQESRLHVEREIARLATSGNSSFDRLEDRRLSGEPKLEAPKKSVGNVPDAPKKTSAARPSFTDFDIRIGEAVARLIEGGAGAKLAEVNAQLAKLNELEAAGLDSAFISEARAKLYEQLPAKIESASEAFRRLEVSGTDAVNAAFNTEAIQRYQEQAARLRETLAALKDGNAVLREEIEILLGGEGARREAEQTRLRSAIAIKEETLALRERSGASEQELAGLRREIELLRERQGLLGKRNEAEDTTRKSAEFRGTIEQGLRGTFSSVLRGDFKSVGEMWKQLLADMVAQALAAQVARAIFGNTGAGDGGGGGTGSIWGTIIKLLFSAKGNAFGQAGLIPFAGGGVFDSPTAFSFGGGKLGVMGEAGPEAVMPLRRGRDGRLGIASTGGAGGVNIVQHITVEAGASRNEVMVAAQAARRAAVNDIMELQRRGRWSAG